MTTRSGVSTAQEDVREEFHSKPVPLSARLGFRDPALVWSGFGIAYICAVIGGLIQQGLGTTNAILAIALGNFILFLYSAAIGYGDRKSVVEGKGVRLGVWGEGDLLRIM